MPRENFSLPCLHTSVCLSHIRVSAEYCARGSVYDVLRSAAQQPELAAALTWRLRLRMAAEAATGILYLHSHSPPIVHRDIKGPNLVRRGRGSREGPGSSHGREEFGCCCLGQHGLDGTLFVPKP